MKPQFSPLFSSTVAPLKNLTRLVAGASFMVGLLSIGLPTLASSAQATPQKPASTAVNSSPLVDGVYLYGQSSQPNQIGKAYFVFEVRQGNVVGALFMPRSSFDCAYGTFQPDRVALTVVDSYDKSENPYAIALERTASVATRGNPALKQISLEGFEPLTTLSENDRRILDVCKQNYQQRVWK
ncbi:hypothetical protein C7B65_13430 [Phormidesmis priestleyi ULC007]|uniref:Uncharacterized protein n=1 Tax=Phormidesmis priestleyi ULC007 TaxID=1920490 RepID=A0A2T1DEZ6_9CYAN|nr:hypothetical protein [Phormidesmis priestleyi]PSB19011.1 hypothetical protein C7B65_13430 [Phormidesmis priestleyi ULC007]PZO53999.1 MAG: hypothetical protein DCF14_03485 [Phormidesmis priestleyi]